MRIERANGMSRPCVVNNCLLVSSKWDDYPIMFDGKMVIAVAEKGLGSAYDEDNMYTFASWVFFTEDTETDWDCLLPEVQLDIAKKVIETVKTIYPDDIVPWTEEQQALVALENL